MNDNMPGNSRTALAKQESAPPAFKPVEDKGKKKSIVKTVGRAIFDSSAMDGAKLDIVNDIVVPAVKNTTLDIVSAIMGTVTSAFELALFGTVSKRGKRYGRYTAYGERYRDGDSRVTIVRGSEDRDYREDRRMTASRRDDYYEVIFDDENKSAKENYDDAVDALEKLRLLFDHDSYKYVTIGDIYDVCEKTSYSSFQDRKWGWRSLGSARVDRLSGGAARLVLSRPEYIRD